jgi:basic amino acid/polyamine antiporter, APA family
MFGLIIGVLFFSDSSTFANLNSPEGAAFTFGGFGLAMLSALWAYDGWNNMPMAAGEIHNPQRNVPLSLTFGVLLVLVIYLLVNFGYFLALPFSEALSSNSDLHPEALPIATKAAQTFLGVAGLGVVSIGFMISALGAMNGSVLTNARVPYAMAQDRLFFKALGIVHEKSNVPLISVLVQGVIASVMAFMGTFNQLTDYVIFSSWLFYMAVAVAVIVLRRRLPNHPRSYKVWGYPVVPALFVLVSCLLVVNTVMELPVQSLYGLGIILLGVPVYYFFHPRWKKN